MAAADRTLTFPADAVSWAPTEEDAVVVLDLRTSKYLSLNASGSVLWHLLADGATTGALRDALVARFGLTGDAATADVEAFVQSLRDRDLIVER